MLSASDFPREKALAAFADYGVETAFLVPTRTGLQKSIMDAHMNLRVFLHRHGFHDFDRQQQGPDNATFRQFVCGQRMPIRNSRALNRSPTISAHNNADNVLLRSLKTQSSPVPRAHCPSAEEGCGGQAKRQSR